MQSSGTPRLNADDSTVASPPPASASHSRSFTGRSPTSATQSRSYTGRSPTPVPVVEDSVDVFLEKQDGRIYRKRDDQL